MTPYLVSFSDAARRLSITSARLRSLIDAGLLTPHPIGTQIEVRSYNHEQVAISRYHVLDVGKRIVISELNDAKGDERKVIV